MLNSIRKILRSLVFWGIWAALDDIQNLPEYFEALDLRRESGSRVTSWCILPIISCILVPVRWAYLAMPTTNALLFLWISKWVGDIIIWVMSGWYVFYILGTVHYFSRHLGLEVEHAENIQY